MTRIVTRPCSPVDAEVLTRCGLHPVLARLYAARGVCLPEDIETGLARLVPPAELKGCDAAAALLADALQQQRRMLVVADYDCDGATACAVAVRGLRMFGARIDYLVPNRMEHGYGLTPDIVELATRSAAGKPDLLITVDNGIASVDGVAAANALGIDVLVTDHHLPGDELPAARAIVNPNQPGCTFPSKCIAGVGVMFYVLLALRAELRRRGAFGDALSEPRLDGLLDLVALGTVADVVKLDGNNRVLVAQGLQRIRRGRMQPGIAALFRAAARDARNASGFDLGFALGPRLNAAGRLSDMSLGIECLTTDDVGRAWELAQQLDAMNRERREIEAGMQQQALDDLSTIDPDGSTTITLFNPGWHQGVIGIVAGRLKEKFHRPSFTFAPADATGVLVKGSGRSIGGFHLRERARSDLEARAGPDRQIRRPRDGGRPDDRRRRRAALHGRVRGGRPRVAVRGGARAHCGNRRRARRRILHAAIRRDARRGRLGPRLSGAGILGRVRGRLAGAREGQAPEAATAARPPALQRDLVQPHGHPARAHDRRLSARERHVERRVARATDRRARGELKSSAKSIANARRIAREAPARRADRL
ncbi:single-stranded-DNA-specific exonuclease [Paraburkholderia sp. WC7.3d]